MHVCTGSPNAGPSTASSENSKVKKKQQPLIRPIVCICNDLYVAQLRPLREIAKVFHLGPPERKRLESRLREVARSEGVSIEHKVW